MISPSNRFRSCNFHYSMAVLFSIITKVKKLQAFSFHRFASSEETAKINRNENFQFYSICLDILPPQFVYQLRAFPLTCFQLTHVCCITVSCNIWEGFLPCRNRQACVPLTQMCDGQTDCADATDERECGKWMLISLPLFTVTKDYYLKLLLLIRLSLSPTFETLIILEMRNCHYLVWEMRRQFNIYIWKLHPPNTIHPHVHFCIFLKMSMLNLSAFAKLWNS